jgi:hypothetical protein
MSLPRLLLLVAGAAAVAAAAPPKNCTAPPNVVPVVPEGLCYTEVVPTNPSGIAIRLYKGTPNATLVQAGGNGPFPSGLQSAIANVISYFSGNNDDQENILSARTVPFLVVPPDSGGGRSPYWTASLEVSPTQFPDNFLIPRPLYPSVTLTKVNDNLGLFAVFQFNTTGFPYIENIEEACGVIQDSTLPPGYAINTTNFWSPTYVFYNGQGAAEYTSECWMAVSPTGAQ